MKEEAPPLVGGVASPSDQPVCVAIIICNEIIEDKRTSNKTLVSLFNSVGVQALPVTHPRLFLMASLTNLRTDLPVSFSIKSPSGREILRVNGAASSGGDPLAVIDLVVEVLGLSLGEEGVHFVDVLTGDAHVVEHGGGGDRGRLGDGHEADGLAGGGGGDGAEGVVLILRAAGREQEGLGAGSH